MLDCKEGGVTMTSTHKISFSIIDILDPKKFNSKRTSELSIGAEKFPASNAEKNILRSDSSTAEGDFRAAYAEAGEKNGTFEILSEFILLRRLNVLQKRNLRQSVDYKNTTLT